MEHRIYSNAKLNIGLNISNKRDDGYHNLDMIMAPINLYDELIIDIFNEKGDIEINCSNKDIPVNKDNIISKMYNLFFEKTGIEKKKILVNINKKIPIQAGLGGGSSNGAFFIKYLNDFYDTNFNTDELIDMSKKIGADIPFFLVNKLSRVQGIGDKLFPLDIKLKEKVLLIKPKFGIETKGAFTNYHRLNKKYFSDFDKIISEMRKGSIENLNDLICNSLEQSLLINNKNLFKFKERLSKYDRLKFFMTGSGSCFFAFLSENIEENYITEIKKDFENCFISVNETI